jgi:hypothetical protein
MSLHQGAERTTVGFTLAFNLNTFCGSYVFFTTTNRL